MSYATNSRSLWTKVVLIGATIGLVPAFAGDAGADDPQQAIDRPTEAATPTARPDLPDTFGALDRDGDGVLSEKEGARIENERWKRMDSDGDGKVERSEFSAVELDAPLKE